MNGQVFKDNTKKVEKERSADLKRTSFCYLVESPMVLPKLISPLSMRMEKPQTGLEQTQALYLMLAPSLP